MSSSRRTPGILAVLGVALLPAAATAAPLTIGVIEAGRDPGILAHAARSAVTELNAAGGLEGRTVGVVRIGEGPAWQTGAGRIASLVFGGGVLAVVGPEDGAGAHLAAQAATKAGVPLVALSPEASITQAGAPWVFRAVPTDEDQATALLTWALPRREGRRVAALVPAGREGRERAEALRRACEAAGAHLAHTAEEPSELGAGPAADLNAVLLWLDASEAADAAPALRRALDEIGDVPLLGSARLDDAAFLEASHGLQVGVPDLGHGGAGAARGALARDAVAAVLAAARAEGADATGVRKGLTEGGPFRGETGTFRFDGRGNRAGDVSIGVIEGGTLRAAPAQSPWRSR